MNLKDQMIMDEYRAAKPDFERLEKEVTSILTNIAETSNILIYGIDHRVKEENSLAGKLERKGDKYLSLSDITDILGARMVCYFSDDVDKLAEKVQEHFKIDWNESIDKRKILNVDSFGYLSVHYICSLKEEDGYPPELTEKRFEIQMRSLMQHIWAVMNHDLGYKTKFGIPTAIQREFFRLAGLLEIADEHFVSIRDNVTAYTKAVHEKILTDNANELPIDSVSLEEYMNYSENMNNFLKTIGNVCNAEITKQSPENYLEQLNWFKKRTIGDLQQMLTENYSLALQMIEKRLANAELDILSSTVALRFLCHAELVNKGYNKELMTDFFMLSMSNRERAEKYSQKLIDEYLTK